MLPRPSRLLRCEIATNAARITRPRIWIASRGHMADLGRCPQAVDLKDYLFPSINVTECATLVSLQIFSSSKPYQLPVEDIQDDHVYHNRSTPCEARSRIHCTSHITYCRSGADHPAVTSSRWRKERDSRIDGPASGLHKESPNQTLALHGASRSRSRQKKQRPGTATSLGKKAQNFVRSRYCIISRHLSLWIRWVRCPGVMA